MRESYWTKRRLGMGAAVVVIGGLLIARNVTNRVELISTSPLGATCAESSDCSSGSCISYEGRYLCTHECAPDGQCEGATHCVDVAVTRGNRKESKRYCVP